MKVNEPQPADCNKGAASKVFLSIPVSTPPDRYILGNKGTGLTSREKCSILHALADRRSFIMNELALRIWRNWQTRYFEVVVE